MAKKPSEGTEMETSAASGEVMTKLAAIQAALDAGHDVPADGTKYIFDTFGLSVSNETFSTTKSKLKKKSSGDSGTKPATKSAKTSGKIKVASKPAPKPATAAKPATTSSQSVELAREVKKLVEQYGVETVREMAKLFAK